MDIGWVLLILAVSSALIGLGFGLGLKYGCKPQKDGPLQFRIGPVVDKETKEV
jgi:hypothetical protein